MEKKITVKEFVDTYLSLNSDQKDEYIKKSVTRKYAPILEKRLMLETLNKGAVNTVDGVKYFDFIISKVNIAIATMMLYTNVEVSKSTDLSNNIFTDYDLLKSSNVLYLIANEVGESEMSELGVVNQLITDIYYERTNSFRSYISGIFAKIPAYIDALFGAISEYIIKSNNKEETTE